MRYTCYGRSKAEAEMIADAWRQQEGCIDSRAYGWSVTVHLEIGQDVPPEALPEGCCLVPAEVVAALQRHNRYDGVVKRL